MKPSAKLIKILRPIIILVIGLAAMAGMVLSKTPPEKIENDAIGTLVETIPLTAENHRIKIHATGTVQPASQVSIIPQVGGRVVRMAEGFQEGRFFDKGRLLFEIEDTDYALVVEKSRAEIARTEFDLANVESQARVARLEWERVNPGTKTRPNPLVLYGPQLKQAKAALAGAKADLKQRLLDLDRTKVYAPFNCRIRSKSVDVGQYLSAGKAVATVAGTDRAEIVIPVPLQDLKWIDVPRTERQTGSEAHIFIDRTGSDQWMGRVDRSLGEVDAHSRMIRLVVTVDDPYGLRDERSAGLGLAEGLFVNVTLEGKILEKVWAVPPGALRHQETLWLMGKDNALDIVPVEVLRRDENQVLVRGPLEMEKQLVTTRISGAVQGMQLRLPKEEQS